MHRQMREGCLIGPWSSVSLPEDTDGFPARGKEPIRMSVQPDVDAAAREAAR